MPANEVIERFFNDSDPSLRVLAARTMSDPEPKSIQFVCSLTSQKAFDRKSTTEKKAWIDFLRKTGSDSIVPALGNLLNRRSWFRRRQNNEIRIYVVSALGSLATECALETLRKGARTGNRNVRNACRLALNKPRRKGQDPQFLHAHDEPEEE
jgi:HEAT repeat protein